MHEWRIVYFLTATLGDAEDYDTDSQHLPWTLAVNVLRDIGRAQQLAYEYREYAPWAHSINFHFVDITRCRPAAAAASWPPGAQTPP